MMYCTISYNGREGGEGGPVGLRALVQQIRLPEKEKLLENHPFFRRDGEKDDAGKDEQKRRRTQQRGQGLLPLAGAYHDMLDEQFAKSIVRVYPIAAQIIVYDLYMININTCENGCAKMDPPLHTHTHGGARSGA